MNDSTESQLSLLEGESKALKASYPIASSLVKMEHSISQTFSMVGSATAAMNCRIQFESDNTNNAGMAFVTLWALVSTHSNFSDIYDSGLWFNEPQQGDGKVVAQVQIGAETPDTVYYIRVIALGASTGSFSLL